MELSTDVTVGRPGAPPAEMGELAPIEEANSAMMARAGYGIEEVRHRDGHRGAGSLQADEGRERSGLASPAIAGRCSVSISRTAAMSGIVIVLRGNTGEYIDDHVRARNIAVARHIASIKGYTFCHSVRRPPEEANPYFVPHTTLVDPAFARQLGIRSEKDLFGGIVVCPYQATKTLAHTLVGAHAERPAHWCATFAEAVKPLVLPGYSAFCTRDLAEAVSILLEHGDVRLKRALGSGGEGQFVVRDRGDAAAVAAQVPAWEIKNYGVVVESNLRNTTTISVGTSCINDLTISYVGIQRKTTSNSGGLVYGGSDLTFVRGGLDTLLALPVSSSWKTAILQGSLYNSHADKLGAIISRRNYDICQGYDAQGQFHSGVTEQSWRIGGASTIEVMALDIFKNDPTAVEVRASSYSAFGRNAQIPTNAVMYYDGIDHKYGPMKVYSVVHAVRSKGTTPDDRTPDAEGLISAAETSGSTQVVELLREDRQREGQAAERTAGSTDK